MGAGSLLSGGLSVAELKQQLNRAGTGTMSSNFSHTARAHKAQEIPLTGMEKELQHIERDIVLQQSQLALEQARSAALERQANVTLQLKQTKEANNKRSKELGTHLTATSTLNPSSKGIPAALPRNIRYEKLALCFRCILQILRGRLPYDTAFVRVLWQKRYTNRRGGLLLSMRVPLVVL